MAVNTTNMRSANGSEEVFFEIRSYLGVLAEYQTGWKKEINLVSWNGSAPKYDIRDWSPDHDRMSRGITLREEEARCLAAHLAERFVKSNKFKKPAENRESAEAVREECAEAAREDAVEDVHEDEAVEQELQATPSSDGCLDCDEEFDEEAESMSA